MSVEEALAELQHILGKGLHPTAISKVREVLIKVKGDNAHGNKGSPKGNAQNDTSA
jgi:hypothetical protein